MLRSCFLTALMAASLMAAANTNTQSTTRITDSETLVKQKKIFELLMYEDRDILNDTQYFEIGRDYDVMSNVERYDNRELVMDFMKHYTSDMLKRDSLFTYYKEDHREEMMLLFRLFYSAKDFDTFYETACWARIYINPCLFTPAFTTAFIYRSDTKFISLPLVHEMYPNMFFDNKVIRAAQRIAMIRGKNDHDNLRKTDVDDTAETYRLFANFTSVYPEPMYKDENKLAYFMEDVGLNAYYYYFRMMFPFWINTDKYNVPKHIRGDLYYFIHQQLMARYHLERISNGLGEVEEFTWDTMDLPGFYSNIVYSNGFAMPRRGWWYKVPEYKLKHAEYVKKLEKRLSEAIESGYVIDEMGKHVSLMTNDGLNILGNIMEGNYDSINQKYYSSYDTLAREILGSNIDTENRDNYVPSSLQYFTSSIRDPAFFRIYSNIVRFFLRYKSNLNRYTRNELEFSSVKFENVEVDKLVTYHNITDFLITNAVDLATAKDAQSFNIIAWQYQLNYKPFTYKISIKSVKNAKSVFRIFLGPAALEDQYDDYSYLLNYHKYFFMLDEFKVSLTEGTNNIDRKSTDSVLFKKDYLTGDKFYEKIVQAIQDKKSVEFDDRIWGFPDHLMLPKGTIEGMKLKLFFYIGPLEESEVMDLPFFGKRMWYGKALGFPLDRPMQPWFVNLENIYLKDALIYHDVTLPSDHQINDIKN